MAQDRDMQQDDVLSKAPISAHPAFPLIVGLWFAALLGLGTVVLPAVVLQKAAGLTGLSAVFPQTDAPLAAGARVAFALLAAMLGLVGGLLLARRVAEGQAVAHTPRRRTPRAGAPPRPLSVHEDLGEAAIAPTLGEPRNPIPGRRRALAAIEDEQPNEFGLAAPLPGDEAVVPPQLPFDGDSMDERPSDIELPTQPGDEPDLPNLVAEADAPEPYVPPFDTRKPRDLAAPRPPEALEPLSLDPIDAPLEDLGIVQLAERLGRSMQRRLSEPKPEPEPETAPLAFSAPSLGHEEEPGEAPLAVPPPVVPDALRAFMDSPPEEFAPQPAAAPEEAQPFAFDDFEIDEDEDEDDESYSSLLSMKSPFRPAEEFAGIGEPEDDDAAGESIPAGAAAPAKAARPFDAPHRPAPSTASARSRAAPDPVETERALRSALATLQRMSGAA